MHILITGGTGFIGRALCSRLVEDGHAVTVLSREPGNVSERIGLSAVRALGSLSDISADAAIDAIFNFSGAPIVDRRWTSKRRQLLRDSRIGVTEQIAVMVDRLNKPPSVMISGSAIGFYGDRGDEILDEASSGGVGFSAELCRDWEQAARAVASRGVRVCLLRTGVVLHPSGGALRRMLPAFRMGLGGPIGSGTQWFSWIHRDDLVSMALFLLHHSDSRGAWNATAPHPVTNRDFARALGSVLGRPAVVPVPEWVLRMGLGEASSLLLDSQRVLPDRALQAGFNFRYLHVGDALADLR